MGVGREGRGRWIFIHDADKVEESLMVLLFGLFFRYLSPGNFSIDALDIII